MGGGKHDVKDVNWTNLCKCCPLDCDSIVRIVNANSTEEPLVTESKSHGKGDVNNILKMEDQLLQSQS